MWQMLASCVSRKPAKRPNRIAIADSKKLYSSQKSNGLEHLERGILTMLACMDHRPTSLRAMLPVVAPSCVDFLAPYAWYGDDLPLPHCVSPTSVALCANAMGMRLAQTGIGRPLGMRAEVVLEGEYNRLVTATDNKSVTLFDVAARLLVYLWNLLPDKDIRIYVDRQGGRMRYLPGLQRIFPDCQFKIIDETDRVSAYRIQDGRRTGEVWFMVEGEDQHMPIALASMLSKYLRELFMTVFNLFWRKHLPTIAPTAGYYGDGNRFFDEIQPAIRQLGLDAGMLYRCR